MRKLSIWLVFLCFILAGCAGPPGPSTFANVLEQVQYRANAPNVIVQICLPGSHATDRLGFGTVQLARPQELFYGSVSGTGLNPVGTTTGMQSYYEHYADLPGETTAIVVSRIDNELQYVFRLPARLSAKEWSQWMRPNFSTTDKDIKYRLLSGRVFEDAPSSENAPSIRYILMPFNEYLKKSEGRRLGRVVPTVPACTGPANLSVESDMHLLESTLGRAACWSCQMPGVGTRPAARP
jgi:hypothetical protein